MGDAREVRSSRLTPARSVAAAFALLFVFAAAVQHNDPDPLPWMALYLTAAANAALVVVKRPSRVLAALVATVTLLWAGSIALSARGTLLVPSHFTSWQMHDDGSEEAREIGGLLLVASFCAATALRFRRRSPVERAASRTPSDRA